MRQRTWSGRWIDLLNPDPATIVPQDLAWHLSLECRWTGACSRHYSVAEHSLWVAEWARALAPDALKSACWDQGVIHDAQEAFLKDVPVPLKRLLAPLYGPIEERMALAVRASLGMGPLDPKVDAIVHVADKVCAWIESDELTACGPTGIQPRPEFRELEVRMRFAIRGNRGGHFERLVQELRRIASSAKI